MTGIFPCTWDGCNMVFRRDFQLRKHMAIHEDPDRVHYCPACDFYTLDPRNLKTHKTQHTGEKNILCPDTIRAHDEPGSAARIIRCPYRTNDRSLLTRHRKKKHAYIPRPRTSPSQRPVSFTFVSARNSSAATTKTTTSVKQPKEVLKEKDVVQLAKERAVSKAKKTKTPATEQSSESSSTSQEERAVSKTKKTKASATQQSSGSSSTSQEERVVRKSKKKKAPATQERSGSSSTSQDDLNSVAAASSPSSSASVASDRSKDAGSSSAARNGNVKSVPVSRGGSSGHDQPAVPLSTAHSDSMPGMASTQGTSSRSHSQVSHTTGYGRTAPVVASNQGISGTQDRSARVTSSYPAGSGSNVVTAAASRPAYAAGYPLPATTPTQGTSSYPYGNTASMAAAQQGIPNPHGNSVHPQSYYTAADNNVAPIGAQQGFVDANGVFVNSGATYAGYNNAMLDAPNQYSFAHGYNQTVVSAPQASSCSVADEWVRTYGSNFFDAMPPFVSNKGISSDPYTNAGSPNTITPPNQDMSHVYGYMDFMEWQNATGAYGNTMSATWNNPTLALTEHTLLQDAQGQSAYGMQNASVAPSQGMTGVAFQPATNADWPMAASTQLSVSGTDNATSTGASARADGLEDYLRPEPDWIPKAFWDDIWGPGGR